ncbi:MAG TPA: glycine cleavage system protein GcvH [Acidimicrobiales bacterium]|nr:glycine cleavage system protein GcvH [Acidimicrobiales bacterium]
MNVPEDLRYTADHEWARSEGDRVRVGITDFAQDALGDVVFVELPEAGTTLEKGGPLGEVESTKSVSQVYSPISGTVVEVNSELANAPERLNQEPYGGGWLVVIEPADPGELDGLLDAAGYRATTE